MTSYRAKVRHFNRPAAPRCYCPECGRPTGRGWRPRLCTGCKRALKEPRESLRDFRKRLKGSGH